MILEIRQLWFIAHNLLPLLFCDCIKLFGFSAVDICYKVCYSSSYSWNLWLWGTSLYMANLHNSPRLRGDFIFRQKWINCSFGDPLLRIDVLVIEFEVRTLSRHILFKVTWLSTLNSVSVEIIRSSFYVSLSPIYIWFDLRYITHI